MKLGVPVWWHHGHSHACVTLVLASVAWLIGGRAEILGGLLFVLGLVVRDAEKEDGPTWPGGEWVVALTGWVLLLLILPHAWLPAGFGFYLARELRDRQRGGTWDWRGLLWPLGSTGLFWVPLVVAT